MESTKQWDDDFEALLRKAFREVHEREMAELDDLAKAQPPIVSERHEARMRALINQENLSQE